MSQLKINDRIRISRKPLPSEPYQWGPHWDKFIGKEGVVLEIKRSPKAVLGAQPINVEGLGMHIVTEPDENGESILLPPENCDLEYAEIRLDGHRNTQEYPTFLLEKVTAPPYKVGDKVLVVPQGLAHISKIEIDPKDSWLLDESFCGEDPWLNKFKGQTIERHRITFEFKNREPYNCAFSFPNLEGNDDVIFVNPGRICWFRLARPEDTGSEIE